MPRRRGDNIPPVSDYAHWNEEAYAMWYAENRYDMENADEIIEDDDDFEPDYEEYDPGDEVDDEGGMSEHRFTEGEEG